MRSKEKPFRKIFLDAFSAVIALMHIRVRFNGVKFNARQISIPVKIKNVSNDFKISLTTLFLPEVPYCYFYKMNIIVIYQ